MSRLPVGGKSEQPRHGKRRGIRGQKQRAGIDSGGNPIQDLETRRKFKAEFVCGSEIMSDHRAEISTLQQVVGGWDG